MDKGDVVQLKSGGPHMTISSIFGDQAVCIWFDSEGKRTQEDFPLDTLKEVPPKLGPTTGGITRSAVY
jgi:uncharacterized protein YodC (DUF2158 family)